MLTYPLDRRCVRGLYDQLYGFLRDDIERGAIVPGQKLPSKRTSAQHLAVSVITVEAAYKQLAAEGYVSARERSGVFVNDMGPALRLGSALGGEERYRVRSGEEGAAVEADAAGKPCSTWVAPAGDVRYRGGVDNPAGAQPFGGASFAGRLQHCEGEGAEDRWTQLACGHGDSALTVSRDVVDLTGRQGGARVFPYEAWARTQRKVLSECDEPTLLRAGQAQGSLELRQAIAGHLRGFRGMEVSADQVVVGAGAQVLYPFIVQLLGRDRVFALETPGYRRLAQVYASNDVALAAVPLDTDGISVEALAKTRASVVHCMPSHQLPGGMVLPIARRRELLQWAQGAEEGAAATAGAAGLPSAAFRRYIVEDDYDCEFRMAGRPIPPLQAIDQAECVIYANTFTKTLGPALRMAYLVLPPHLADEFRERMGFYSCTASATDQLTLARFIASGDFERHVNRLRTRYRKVLSALVEALEGSAVADRLRLRHVGSGLHFLLEVEGASALQAACALGEHGVAVEPLEAFCLDALCRAYDGSFDGSADGFGKASAPADSTAGTLVINFSDLAAEQVPVVARAFEQAFG